MVTILYEKNLKKHFLIQDNDEKEGDYLKRIYNQYLDTYKNIMESTKISKYKINHVILGKFTSAEQNQNLTIFKQNHVIFSFEKKYKFFKT